MPPSGAKRTEPVWRKASSSASGECVEVAERGGMIVVRNSRNVRGRMLRYTAEEWQAFIYGVKGGEFDDLAGSPKVTESTVQCTESVRDHSAPRIGST